MADPSWGGPRSRTVIWYDPMQVAAAFAEGSVSEASGKLVATATSTLLVFSTEPGGATSTGQPAEIDISTARPRRTD